MNIRPSRLSRMAASRLAFAAWLALAAAGALAQTTYKSTMPDGKIVYGEKPAPGAVKSEPMQVNTKPMSTGKGNSTNRDEDSGVAPQQLKDSRTRAEQARAADADAQQWQQTLTKAQQAAREGVEPLPGERIGTAGGGSRLTDAYQERQRQLQADIVRAQGNYDNALQRLNKLR